MRGRSFKIGNVLGNMQAQAAAEMNRQEELSSSVMTNSSADVHKQTDAEQHDHKVAHANDIQTENTLNPFLITDVAPLSTTSATNQLKRVGPRVKIPPVPAPARSRSADASHQGSCTVEPKPIPFQDRYERMTTYIEKPLHRRVHSLHHNGTINRMTSLLNAALKEYLDKYYPIS